MHPTVERSSSNHSSGYCTSRRCAQPRPQHHEPDEDHDHTCRRNPSLGRGRRNNIPEGWDRAKGRAIRNCPGTGTGTRTGYHNPGTSPSGYGTPSRGGTGTNRPPPGPVLALGAVFSLSPPPCGVSGARVSLTREE